MIKGLKAILLVSTFLAYQGVSSLGYAQSSLGSSLFDSTSPSQEAEDKRLVVEAGELVYNQDKGTVSAYDNVELSYQGRSLQADRVTYDQKKDRVFAAGNVRMVEAEGTIVTAEKLELTGGFKDGFIETLRMEKPAPGGLRTRFSSARAERIDGETTILDLGTYTACNTCKKQPERPPLWQIKATRIIHDGKEKTVYYEDARLEVWGIPVAYTPYFWTPDPSVSRKSGFLTPSYSNSSARGFGVSTPFFWALAPNYDLTITPTYLSKQGILGQVEWRHRLETGSYSVRAIGINQNDPDAYAKGRYGAGDKRNRGSLETEGEFFINQNWRWGWNATALTDKWFFDNYSITGKGQSTLFYQEAISTAYLRGVGDRSFFDARGYYFQGLSSYDWQQQQPVVHPVIDYSKRYAAPQVLGGEFQTDFNFTSLSRSAAHYRQTPEQRERHFGLYESCAVFDTKNCLLRGMAGTVSRTSVNQSWQRDYIDSVGQVWKPFFFARGDAYWISQKNSGYQNTYQNIYTNEAEDFSTRAMAGAGIEYRYPLVSRFGGNGSQIFEPIAQLIIRSNESRIGKVPNEDSQNMVFDDTNLFAWNKFSGYDRVEGGTRANVGAQYTIQTLSGARLNVLAGQSLHIAGTNSFSARDFTNTGLDSGLTTDPSDYVGRIQFSPNDKLSFFARGRFNEDSFSAARIEAGASFSLTTLPITGSVFYTQYEEQPNLGINNKREGLFTAANWKVTKNWSVRGSVLFDMNYLPETYITNGALTHIRKWGDDKISARSLSLGLGYDDECVALNVSYTSAPKEVAAANGKKDRDTIFAFTLEFKTLGPISFSQNMADN